MSLLFHLEGRGRHQPDDLVQVVAPDEAPAGLRTQDLEQVFDGNEPLLREDQPEFVGPVAQDVGEHPGHGLQLPG